MRLSSAARALKVACEEQFAGWDEAKRAIFLEGLEARDIEKKCIKIVEKEGFTVPGDRGGTKAHPLLAVIRDSRAQFLMAMKMLKLNVDETGQKAPGRPTDFQLYQKRDKR
jgi:hypothetical protein